MDWIAPHAELVVADVTSESVFADRDDEVFLACALAGGAGVIVSEVVHREVQAGREAAWGAWRAR